MIVLLALTAIFCAGSLSAQMSDRATVERAIIRTGEIIQEAVTIISESRSQIARVSLERATLLQKRATSQFLALHNNFAYKYTMEARKEAWHAIALARADARIEEKLANLTEHTRDKLVRLRERIIESGVRDERLVKLMTESRSLLEKSHMNATQLRNQLALNLAENARKLTIRAEERFRKVLNLKEMNERRLVLMEKLLERARDRIDQNENENGRIQLHHAIQNIEKAKELISDGKYYTAGMVIEKCERILRNLARHISGYQKASPENSLEEALRLLERARERLTEMGGISAEAAAHFERAEALIEQARAEITENRPEEARRLVVKARRLIRSAFETGGPAIEPGNIENEIEKVLELRDTVHNLLNNCSAEGTQSLFDRANSHVDKAMGLFEKSRFQQALAEARIARNLYQRIREICSI